MKYEDIIEEVIKVSNEEKEILNGNWPEKVTVNSKRIYVAQLEALIEQLREIEES